MTRSQEFRIIGYIFIGSSFGAHWIWTSGLMCVIALCWFEAGHRAAKTAETQEGTSPQ